MHLYHNFLKSVFSKPRVNPRIDHGDEIPQSGGRKKSPQVYRHGNLHRLKVRMAVLLLLLQQCIQKHRVQIFRDSGMILLCHSHHFRYGHDAVNDVQSIKGLCSSVNPVRFLLKPGRAHLCIGIPHIGVLQLLRIRLTFNVKHKAAVFNFLMPQQPQISRGKRLQHTHASRAVSETVMGFQRNTVPEIIHPHKISVVCLKMHGLAGVFHILLHKGARSVVWLQISPEQPLSDRSLIGRESGKGHVQRPLKHIRLNFFLQQDRKTIYGRKISSLQCRIDDGGQVKLVPVAPCPSGSRLLFLHRQCSFIFLSGRQDLSACCMMNKKRC